MLKCNGPAELLTHAAEVIPGGVNSSKRLLPSPILWERSEGASLYDVNGKEYIDFHCAFGPIVLGHRHPRVDRAVRETLETLDLIGSGLTEGELRLAEKIVEHIPSADRVHLCNSGSEATYHAVRLARAVTGRQKLIKFQGCYHGWHDYLLMNVFTPAERMGLKDPCSKGILDAAVENTLVLPFNDVGALETTLSTEGQDVAALIMEPIPHNVGCLMPRLDFMHTVRRLCTERGIVLVFDEVITGFRHGLGGYQKTLGVTPDLTTLAKAMANGYPIAAIAGRKDLMSRFATCGGDVYFSGTYNGHPLSTAAALATIVEMEEGTVHHDIFRLGEKTRNGLREIVERLGLPITVAGYGSIFVPYFIEPTGEPPSKYDHLLANDSDKDVAFRVEMIERGFFMLPSPLKRSHLCAAHTDEDIDRMLDATEDVLKAMKRKWAPRSPAPAPPSGVSPRLKPRAPAAKPPGGG